ncbi:hypothetical protein E4U31_002965 [Claviceps sp. LM219 group G6]|nr:hypothetical protein E4U31_002965 [Claviceps sp. LM219 group G6]
MTLTPEQITIVEQYPLKDELDQSRDKLRDFLPSDNSCRSGVPCHRAPGRHIIVSTPASETLLDPEVVKIKKEKIFQEVKIKNSLFRSVKGFWEKFFGTGRWESDSTDLHQTYKNILKEHRNGKWVGLPMNANEHSVLKWFWGLENAYLQSAPNKI